MKTVFFDKMILDPVAALRGSLRVDLASSFGARVYRFTKSEVVARIVGLFASLVAALEVIAQLCSGQGRGMARFAGVVLIGSIVGVMAPGSLRRFALPAPASALQALPAAPLAAAGAGVGSAPRSAGSSPVPVPAVVVASQVQSMAQAVAGGGVTPSVSAAPVSTPAVASRVDQVALSQALISAVNAVSNPAPVPAVVVVPQVQPTAQAAAPAAGDGVIPSASATPVSTPAVASRVSQALIPAANNVQSAKSSAIHAPEPQVVVSVNVKSRTELTPETLRTLLDQRDLQPEALACQLRGQQAVLNRPDVNQRTVLYREIHAEGSREDVIRVLLDCGAVYTPNQPKISDADLKYIWDQAPNRSAPMIAFLLHDATSEPTSAYLQGKLVDDRSTATSTGDSRTAHNILLAYHDRCFASYLKQIRALPALADMRDLIPMIASYAVPSFSFAEVRTMRQTLRSLDYTYGSASYS